MPNKKLSARETINAVADRLEQMSAGFESIGDGVGALTEGGNKDMSGWAAFGLGELMGWAAAQLKEMAQRVRPPRLRR